MLLYVTHNPDKLEKRKKRKEKYRNINRMHKRVNERKRQALARKQWNK